MTVSQVHRRRIYLSLSHARSRHYSYLCLVARSDGALLLFVSPVVVVDQPLTHEVFIVLYVLVQFRELTDLEKTLLLIIQFFHVNFYTKFLKNSRFRVDMDVFKFVYFKKIWTIIIDGK